MLTVSDAKQTAVAKVWFPNLQSKLCNVNAECRSGVLKFIRSPQMHMPTRPERHCRYCNNCRVAPIVGSNSEVVIVQ